MSKELSEAEVDAIWDDAKDAAINAWGPLGSPNFRPNPYPLGSRAAKVWDGAFRSAYASENGY